MDHGFSGGRLAKQVGLPCPTPKCSLQSGPKNSPVLFQKSMCGSIVPWGSAANRSSWASGRSCGLDLPYGSLSFEIGIQGLMFWMMDFSPRIDWKNQAFNRLIWSFTSRHDFPVPEVLAVEVVLRQTHPKSCQYRSNQAGVAFKPEWGMSLVSLKNLNIGYDR